MQLSSGHCDEGMVDRQLFYDGHLRAFSRATQASTNRRNRPNRAAP